MRVCFLRVGVEEERVGSSDEEEEVVSLVLEEGKKSVSWRGSSWARRCLSESRVGQGEPSV